MAVTLVGNYILKRLAYWPRLFTVRAGFSSALVALLLLWSPALPQAVAADTPAEKLKAYLKAIYARDYATAYELISLADRKLKTRQQYIEENGAFTGGALELAAALATLIRFENVHTEIEGKRATVMFKAIVPDANATAIQELLLEFDQERLDALSPAERVARAEQLKKMARGGDLPVIVGTDERWELVQEEGDWHVSLNWADAVTIHFEAVTQAGLPWEFTPLQSVIRAMPGETLQNVYRVKNLTDRDITGKARHIITPAADTRYLEVVFCFCFIQQTLEPGEEKQFSVVFRVNYDIPDSITQMRVRYEFYPLESFPEGSTP